MNDRDRARDSGGFSHSFWGKNSVRLVALGIILVLYGFTRQPTLDGAERTELASRFAFERLALPVAEGAPAPTSLRRVHPSLRHLEGWISAVGAAVALYDLDGDGLANEVCTVDTRIDRVTVAPVPGTGERFQPFFLEPGPLPFDAETTAPMGCLPGDFDEDGAADLLVYYWGRTPILFLRTAGEEMAGLAAAAFTPHEVVPYEERWYTNAVTRADFDGDGHADLVIGNYFPDDSWILGADAPGTEKMQHSMSRADNAGRNRVLLWTGGQGTDGARLLYREVEGVLPHWAEHGWTLALGAADLDGDLLPELYVANDFGPDQLLHNRSRPGQLELVSVSGRRTLTTPRSKVLGQDSFKGMGVDFADVNGDGRLDIYVSNIAQEWALEENHFLFVSQGSAEDFARGVAPYADRSETLGLARTSWSWDCRLADFDNDGEVEAVQATGFLKGNVNRWPELHELAMGNDDLLRHAPSWPQFGPGDDLSGHRHNPFFVRARSGRFFDLAAELGIDQPQVSRGIATADVDGDGDLDFAVANQWEDSYLFRNEAPGAGAFLGLHLRLPAGETAGATQSRPGLPHADAPSLPAVGAAAVVHLPDGRRLVAQVDGGNGHSGVRSPELHFGLGKLAAAASRLRTDLEWRDRHGKVHRETLYLEPGWHTVLLGNLEETASAADGKES